MRRYRWIVLGLLLAAVPGSAQTMPMPVDIQLPLFLKILKITTSEAKKEKAKKINAVIPRLSAINVGYFAPTKLIKLDERFVNLLTEF